jgi:cytochrome c oxidase cbb3-type subunit 3
VSAQIHQPRHGVMPSWGGRLDPVTVKMLAAYVHSLGGGEKAPEAAATDEPVPTAAP